MFALWQVTAHEAADTVVQILCGQGWTYGLSEYRSLWRKPEEEPEEEFTIDPEAVALRFDWKKQRAINAIKRKATQRERRIAALYKRIEVLTGYIRRHTIYTSYYKPEIKQAKVDYWREQRRHARNELRELGAPV